ncbi:MAG: hypothetical protein GXO98_03245 [Nitrospirae bacterium]|nr:hypothetical protein [Nitrospirota bacterium]
MPEGRKQIIGARIQILSVFRSLGAVLWLLFFISGLILVRGDDVPLGKGSISGKMRAAGKAISIMAFNREENRKYAGSIDVWTGEYVIKDLPEGSYDLILKTEKYLVEGLRLSVPWRSGKKLTVADRKEIGLRIKSVEPFFNKKKILRLSGDEKYAGVLVEQVRDKVYYDNPTGKKVHGKMIRRIDLWRFRKSGLRWVSLWNKHLYREELLSDSPGRQMKHKFEKKFSGIQIIAGSENVIIDYTLPNLDYSLPSE